ncbi:uncharacterized protein LOC130329910 [Hyla sarda]|uniref:uncharacterized protein LOC130329910 n=1 Tax=Hyla sarda TaxID=327740 RepID=UPI0024C39333|nr:uncharacterized protein LOC130329910 [Hyla sarda]
MSKFEEAFVHSFALSEYVLKWTRYVNDVFLLWAGSVEQLGEDVQLLNSCHLLIEFTMEVHHQQIHYLDVEIFKNGTKLESTLFKKQADRNNVLLRQSQHAPQTFNGIPRGQFIRVRRICSNDEEYVKNKEMLIQKFVKRGYEEKVIRKVGEEVQKIPRVNLRQRMDKNKKGNEDKNFSFMSTYDCHAQLIKKTVNKYWGLLRADSKYGNIFEKLPRFIYKKGKSLANNLVRADMKEKRKTKQSFLCTKKKGTFPSIIKTDAICHSLKGTKIPIKGCYSCNSKHVIYMLKCLCGHVYVGQTMRNVKYRINEHRSAIRNVKSKEDQSQVEIGSKLGETGVAKHFHEYGHKVSELRWLVIEEVEGESEEKIKRKLLQQEVYWIEAPNSLSPDGLNELCNFSVFLNEFSREMITM